jgi:hypothetical protein
MRRSRRTMVRPTMDQALTADAQCCVSFTSNEHVGKNDPESRCWTPLEYKQAATKDHKHDNAVTRLKTIVAHGSSNTEHNAHIANGCAARPTIDHAFTADEQSCVPFTFNDGAAKHVGESDPESRWWTTLECKRHRNNTITTMRFHC